MKNLIIEIVVSADGKKHHISLNGVVCTRLEDFQRELNTVSNAALRQALYQVMRMQYVIESE